MAGDDVGAQSGAIEHSGRGFIAGGFDTEDIGVHVQILRDKIIKKKIRNSFLALLMVLLALPVSIYVSIRDPFVQNYLARLATGYLSEQLDTRILIKGFYIDLDLSLTIKGFEAYDQKSNLMFAAPYLRVSMNPQDLKKGLHIRKLVLGKPYASLVKYENEEDLNLQFFTDYFAGESADTAAKVPSADFQLRIDQIQISQGQFQFWDQNKDSPGAEGMDYSHLYIKDIRLSATDISLIGDSIYADIRRLKATDTSGIALEDLHGTFVSGPKATKASGMELVTSNTSLNLDLEFSYESYADFLDFVEKVQIDASIRPSKLYMADIGFFAPVMFDMKNDVSLAGDISGTVAKFSTRDFSFQVGNNTSFVGNYSINGLPDFFNSYMELDIDRLRVNADDLAAFLLPGNKRIAIPEQLKAAGNTVVRGTFKGKPDDFLANARVTTEAGSMHSDLRLFRDKQTNEINYEGHLVTDELLIGRLLDADQIGSLSMNARIKGSGLAKETANVSVDGVLLHLDLLGIPYRQIMLNGEMTGQRYNGFLSVNDEKLKLEFNGEIDLEHEIPVMDFMAEIEHADLYGMNLLHSDTIMQLKTSVRANLTGFRPDELVGLLHVSNTEFIDSRGSYQMDSLVLKATDVALLGKRYELTTDFFEFELGGQVHFATLPEAVNNYINHYMHIPGVMEEEKELPDQDFFMSLNFWDTETLTRLFSPGLSLSTGTVASGVFTTNRNDLDLTFRSPFIAFGDFKMKNIYIKNTSDRKQAALDLSLSEFVFRDSTRFDTTVLGIQRPHLSILVRNDSLISKLRWNDILEPSRNKGVINAIFLPDSIYGGTFHITQSDLIVNDSVWQLAKNNQILFKKEYTAVSNLRLDVGQQFISLDGKLPVNEADTLDISFSNWDISHFDLITMGFGLDLDGIISGELQLANLVHRPAFFSNLHLSGLYLNAEKLGDARIISSWNNTDESIYLNAQIINVGNVSTSRMLNLTGFYYPTREDDNMFFDLNLENFRLRTLNPFLIGVLSNIEGLASGTFKVRGALKQPELTGELDLFRTAFKVDYLNTVYSLQHKFIFEKDRIAFQDMMLYDTTGNKAIVSGEVSHQYLSGFRFRLRMDPDSFIALNTSREMNELFYGSAVVTGDVQITGPLNDINLAINAATNRGTRLFIPLNNSAYVSDHDFIVFVAPPSEEAEAAATKTALPKPAKNFNLNLNATVTPDAGLQIYLPYNMGDLAARGSGNIRMGVNAAGDFTLLGDYRVQSGQFNFVFENLVRKRFELLEGGRISWTGDPLDAELDVKGLYRVKTSLGSLGIVLDSSSSIRNRVNVDCIIQLKNQLFNPDISFSIRLPNADDDTRQMVFSVLDTTNTALMTQQMISLLVLGSFSYAGGSTANLGSSYINVISNQLSSWLSQISKDFDVGLHYKPGDELSNEELEVALSTQLFNDRVTIDGNFGMINNTATTQNASNIVGDVDITVKITKDGRLRAKAFNHSNANSYYYYSNFDNYAPYTQGIGLSYRQEFDNFGELFRRKKKRNTN
ncbi:MAG: translocation/assembly module TamB domain-containing protein [Bacteroidales bacterium]|nr:translocation/assembly module TamB domain-containing protein [Bacteroidales bacterium]